MWYPKLSYYLFAEVTKYKNDFVINRKIRPSSKLLWNNVFSFLLSQVIMKLGSKLFRFCSWLDWQVVHIAFTLNICIPFRRLFKGSTTFFSPVSIWDTGRTDSWNNTHLPLTGSWGEASYLDNQSSSRGKLCSYQLSAWGRTLFHIPPSH